MSFMSEFSVKRRFPNFSLRKTKDRLTTIDSVVSKYTGFTVQEMHSQSRKEDVLHARQAAHWLMVNIGLVPFNHVGHYYKRDHATIAHSAEKIDEARSVYPNVHSELDELATLCREELKKLGNG